VPTGCEWVGDASTRVAVIQASSLSPDECTGERLVMMGQIVAKNRGRVVISCGGLVVSVPTAYVDQHTVQDAAVIFTRATALVQLSERVCV
jgi:hypothetical protein